MIERMSTKIFPHGVREEADGSLTMCCGKKTCPNLKFAPDGSAVISDIVNGAPQMVPFSAEELRALAAAIQMRFGS